MCQFLSRRRLACLAGAAFITMSLPAFAQDKKPLRLLHGKLDIEGFKSKTSGRISASAPSTVFTIGEDAFLVDEDFEADVSLSEAGLVDKIAILSGQALAAFKPVSSRETSLLLPNATGSIRGTGFFVNINEAKPHNYLCCCYGHIKFQDNLSGEAQELKNSYHNAVVIDERGQFQKAPFSVPFGHYDDELVMLEKQVSRAPHWQLPDEKMHFLSPEPHPLST